MSRSSMIEGVLAAAVLVPAWIGPQAQAQEQIDVNAAGACRGALPAFESDIRSRPTGVRNEGNQNIFVTCSLPATLYEQQPLTSAAVLITNSGASNVEVTCTLANGRVFDTVYQTLTQTVGAAGGEWFSYDLRLDHPSGGNLPNFSCNLPPGTEINMVSKSDFPHSP